MRSQDNAVTDVAAHHLFGPSSLDALSGCVRFKYNDSDADAATEGTELHKAFETGDLSGLDDEQRQCVTAIRNFVESLKYSGGSAPEEWEDLPEAKLRLDALTYGTADRVLINRTRKRACVIDAKFTHRETAHDFQLRAYGACVAEMWPEVETVETHVAAPRLNDIASKSYDARLLLRGTRAEIEALYARIEDPATPPEQHEDLCCKCANAVSCPALGATVTVVARGLGLPMPDRFAVDAITTPRDRACAQVLAGALANWSEQVKKLNAAYVEESGDEIPGFKLTRRSTGLRVPKDRTADALSAAKEAFGLPEHTLLGCCSMTVGDVVKAAAEAQGVPEAVAKEHVREALADIAVEGSCAFLTKTKRLSDAALLKQVAAE